MQGTTVQGQGFGKFHETIIDRCGIRSGNGAGTSMLLIISTLVVLVLLSRIPTKVAPR
jgi:hypothetical protein